MNTANDTERSDNPTVKAMRDALRTGGTAHIHVDTDPTAAEWARDTMLVRLTVKCEARVGVKRAESKVTVEGIPGLLRAGHTDAVTRCTSADRAWNAYSETYQPKKGFWYLACCYELNTALESIPSHASVRFEIYLDSHSNETLVNARLHGDSLRLVATWNQGKREVRRVFLLDVSVGPHNSARYGNGMFEK